MPDASHRLDSWKEIAAYLRRTVRTVQRWERTQGLPVRRHPHSKAASVYAFATDLDRWWAATSLAAQSAAGDDDPEEPATHVVVLPYADLTDGAGQQPLCHGIAEELTTMLARSVGVTVAAPSSVLAEVRRSDAVTAARTLGAHVMVEGSIRQHDERLRVSTRLSRTSDGWILHAFQIDGTRAQALAMQDLLARQVRDTLRLQHHPDQRLVRQHSASTDAYELFLRSREAWSQRTPESLRLAVSLAARAIELDDRYALAHSALAMGELVLASYTPTAPAAGMERARRAAARALELDEEIAEGHVVLGTVSVLFDWDWLAAESAFKRALALDARDATAWQWYSLVALARGHTPEAICHARQAEKFDPSSGAIKVHLSWLLYFGRQFEQAREIAQRALDYEPQFARAYFNLNWAYTQLGRHDDALQAMERCIALADYPTYRAALAHACAKAGDVGRARSLVGRLGRSDDYVSSYWLGLAHLALGDSDAAVTCLNEAADRREWFLITAPLEPLLDDVRSDPRFAALLCRVGPRPVSATLTASGSG